MKRGPVSGSDMTSPMMGAPDMMLVRRRKYIKVACGGANQYDIVHEDLRCSLSKACYGFTVLG